MTSVDIISNFLGRLELWIYDNLGEGDGTGLIRTIWKDNPDMASHLADKWLQKVRTTQENLRTDLSSSEVQKAALWNFLTSLDEANHKIFIQYIAENGRPK